MNRAATGAQTLVSELVLFTRDLRVDDHQALTAASRHGPTIGLFVFDDDIVGASTGSVARLHVLGDAIAALRRGLEQLGTGLVVRQGDVVSATLEVAATLGVRSIHLTRDFSRTARRRYQRLVRACAEHESSITVVEHPGIGLVEPGTLAASGGDHFKVFTPYFNRWVEAVNPQPLEPPTVASTTALPAFEPGALNSVRVDASITLESQAAAAVRAPGWRRPVVASDDVVAAFDQWIVERMADYGRHDELDDQATTGLSAALHLGTVSPRRLVQKVLQACEVTSVVELRDAASAGHRRRAEGGLAFVRQLCWRDFNLQLLAARPDLVDRPLRAEPAWHHDEQALQAWKEGRTGFPIVDAGMRQLLAEGWMPNRVRMIAASVLTKHLGIDWRLGARHFMRHLVDGDVANNWCGWQWAAGTGIDTRPGRMFNPVSQGLTHDPDGTYVRRWVAELAEVPAPAIHEPWAGGTPNLLAGDYPPPLVDQRSARADFAMRWEARAPSERDLRKATP